MELVCEADGVPLPAALLASQYQLCANERLLVLPWDRRSLVVYQLDGLTKEPVSLKISHVHRNPVVAMTVGYGESSILCTVSSDMLAIWSNPQDSSADIYEIYANPGACTYVSLSDGSTHCCVCIDRQVLVFNIKERTLEATLEGHLAPVTAAQFFSSKPLVTVSVSEDRTFKVWDVDEGHLLYQSAVLSGSPCICMAVSLQRSLLATGFSDGIVMVFDMSAGKGYKCLHRLDAAKIATLMESSLASADSTSTKEPKTISSIPSWKKSAMDTSATFVKDGENTEGVHFEGGHAILALSFLDSGHHGGRQQVTSAAPALSRDVQISQQRLTSILDTSGKLLVGTAANLYNVSTSSWQVLGCTSLQSPIRVHAADDPHLASECTLPISGSMLFTQCLAGHKVRCIVAGALLASVSVLRVTMYAASSSNEAAIDVSCGGDGSISEGTAHSPQLTFASSDGLLTVLSSVPMCSTSVLRTPQLRPLAKNSPPTHGAVKKKPAAAATRAKLPSTSAARSGVKDQPLTFKSSVKSSGYTAAPRAKMFAPQTKSTAAKGSSTSQTSMISGSRMKALELKATYPLAAACPTHQKARLTINHRPTPINKILFSSSGGSLACATATRTIDVVRAPLSDTSKITTAAGYDGSVVDLSWATQSSRLLGAATDRTVRMWDSRDLSEALLVFDRQLHSTSSLAKGDVKVSGAPGNPAFQNDITHAQFYYMDEFVVIVCGNTFGLYKYHISDEKVDDIKRYRVLNRYKLIKQFSHSSAQSITSLSCVNSFNSYIVMLGGSDKSVDIFDMNVGKSVRVLSDVHTRPVYRICQNEGSTFITHSSPAYDLFLTTAVGDDIKLWDLRESTCVRRYHGHQQRAHQVGMAFSPCARFIAAASEDRSVYIYDIRQTGHLHRLAGHSDVVSDVAFNPKHPQLCCATLDGRVSIYNDKPP